MAAASSLFAPLRVTDCDPPAFRVVVDHADTGPVIVDLIQVTAVTVTRDRRTISSDDHECAAGGNVRPAGMNANGRPTLTVEPGGLRSSCSAAPSSRRELGSARCRVPGQ